MVVIVIINDSSLKATSPCDTHAHLTESKYIDNNTILPLINYRRVPNNVTIARSPYQ